MASATRVPDKPDRAVDHRLGQIRTKPLRAETARGTEGIDLVATLLELELRRHDTARKRGDNSADSDGNECHSGGGDINKRVTKVTREDASITEGMSCSRLSSTNSA